MHDRRGYYEKIVYEIMKKSTCSLVLSSYKIPPKYVQIVNEVLTICKALCKIPKIFFILLFPRALSIKPFLQNNFVLYSF